MRQFEGIFPYLVSPINKNGEVEKNVLENLVNYLIGTGIQGITLFGSTGELPYLNQKQKEEILKTVLKVSNKKIPIIAGVSHFSTTEAIVQAKKFEKLGADGILVALDIYFPLTQDSIFEYFKSVSSNVNLPIVLYHNPQFSKIDFTLDLINELSKISNINYIKYATSDSNKILTILNNFGDRIKIFSATANNPLLVLMFGGAGWMAGPACLIPKECVKLYNLTQEKNWGSAIRMYKQILQINNLFKKYNLASCIKAGLEIQGFPVGDPIAPQHPLTASEKEEVRNALKNVFI